LVVSVPQMYTVRWQWVICSSGVCIYGKLGVSYLHMKCIL